MTLGVILVIGIRATDGDGFYFGGGERQQIIFVLQQYEAFAGGLACDGKMVRIQNRLIGVGQWTIRRIHQALPDFHPQHIADAIVQDGHGHGTFFYQFAQRQNVIFWRVNVVRTLRPAMMVCRTASL